MLLRSRSLCLRSVGFCLSWMALTAADARDSFLYPDKLGEFRRAARIQDSFTTDVARATIYRLDEVKHSERSLLATAQSPQNDSATPEKLKLRIKQETRMWKGAQPMKLADLAAGDILLVNQTAEQEGAPPVCTDIWIGIDTHKQVSERQAKKVAKK